MKRGVSKIEVYDFKKNWCNENKIITKLIRTKASKYFAAPILDVGAGLGDIAYNAFPEKEAICIDVNKVTEDEYPLSKNHKRKQINFFDYKPAKQIHTVFISHTLQFIDEDIKKLNEKIKEIRPEFVITVVNDNTDFIGELIEWAEDNFENANPEIRMAEFPRGYSLKKRIPFKAKLRCPDFDILAKQIGYLMVIDLREEVEQLKEYLKSKLSNAEFSFKQSIDIYQRNGR